MWVGRLRAVLCRGQGRAGQARAWRAFVGVCCAVTVLGLAGCAWFRSAINDSPEIRWWLFSRYGAERMCPEMQRRSAPLRLTAGGNVIGRLFPSSCQSQVNEARRTVSLEFTGSGYAWTAIAGRVGFSVRAGV